MHSARLSTVVLGARVGAKELPHQHSRRHSEPAYLKPRAVQKAVHSWLVMLSVDSTAPDSVRKAPSVVQRSSGEQPRKRQPAAVRSV